MGIKGVANRRRTDKGAVAKGGTGFRTSAICFDVYGTTIPTRPSPRFGGHQVFSNRARAYLHH